MTEFREYCCPVCGLGTVSMAAVPGMVRHFRRGVVREIPRDVLVPRCDRCGEVFLAPEDSERIDQALTRALRKEQPHRLRALVNVLRERHGATLAEIEKACAVTPSYLSHVVGGGRLASETLVRLIEAFVVCPREFERYRSGIAAHSLDVETEARLLSHVRPATEVKGSAGRTKDKMVGVTRRPAGTYSETARGHPSAVRTGGRQVELTS